MPTYNTPNSIDVAIDVTVGDIEIIASDRSDTVVTVVPTNPSKEADRKGAENTKVEFDGSRLTIVGPRPRVAVFGPNESIDVKVELPTGSRLTADLSVGGLRSTGRLGATRVKGSLGAASIDATGDLWLRNSHGGIVVRAIDGTAEVTADHGQIRLGAITGDTTVKASHGSVTIESVGGELEAKLSYGDLDVGRADASVAAKTAYGNMTLGDVGGGSIELESGFGEVTVGVREGVAAWLDLSSKKGHVRNHLDSDAPPAAGDPSVSVRVRTQFGNITVNRAK